MVKSKKMSKTSIAVIILALLLVLSMVLGLTGAWFTRSDSGTDTGNQTELRFGTVGPINISVGSTTWSDINGESPTQLDGETARTLFMPGDKLETGDIVIRYDETYANSEWGAANPAASETKVYYLINDGSRDFVVNADGELELEDGAAAEIQAGEANKLTVSGSAIAIQIGGVWYKLDGQSRPSATGADYENAKGSCDIPTSYGSSPATEVGGSLLSGYSAVLPGDISFAWTAGTTVYTVQIIQHTNLSAEEAFELLTVGA